MLVGDINNHYVVYSMFYLTKIFSPFWLYFVFFSSQERFYFGDNILPCFESGIPLLKNRLQQLPDSDNVSIFFLCTGVFKIFKCILCFKFEKNVLFLISSLLCVLIRVITLKIC